MCNANESKSLANEKNVLWIDIQHVRMYIQYMTDLSQSHKRGKNCKRKIALQMKRRGGRKMILATMG